MLKLVAPAQTALTIPREMVGMGLTVTTRLEGVPVQLVAVGVNT